MKQRGVLLAALLLGLFVRIAALPLPGTEDVGTWKIWAFGASRNVTHVYGVGGDPPVRGVVKWQTLETTVDYPPAALYELGLVGLAYRRIDPAFADAPALTVAIKLPGLICGIALTALLAWAAKRFTIARWRRFVGSSGLLAESSDHHQRRSPRLPRSPDDAAGHRRPGADPRWARWNPRGSHWRSPS